MNTPATPETTQDDWLSLCDALVRLKERVVGDEHGARVTIILWASAGLLRTKAQAAYGFFGGRILNERNWPIPVTFWQHLGEHEDFAWQTGNFGLALTASPGFDVRRHRNLSPLGVVGVKVHEADLIERFRMLPPLSPAAGNPTVAAERECEDWLRTRFADDPQKLQPKAFFQKAALGHFGSRLSVRGFGRVWQKLAPDAGRSSSGRKSLHRIDSPENS